MSNINNLPDTDKVPLHIELLVHLRNAFRLEDMLKVTDPVELHRIQGQQAVLQHLEALYKTQNPEE